MTWMQQQQKKNCDDLLNAAKKRGLLSKATVAVTLQLVRIYYNVAKKGQCHSTSNEVRKYLSGMLSGNKMYW